MSPHVATAIPADLAARAREIAEHLRTAEDPTAVREDAIAVILELAKVGLEAFFLRPAERLELGWILQSAVEMGLRTATGAIGVFIKKVGRSLDADQGRRLGVILDEMLIDLVFEDDDEDADDAEA